MIKNSSIELILAIFVTTLITVLDVPIIFENVLAQQTEDNGDRSPGGDPLTSVDRITWWRSSYQWR